MLLRLLKTEWTLHNKLCYNNPTKQKVLNNMNEADSIVEIHDTRLKAIN